MFVDRIDGQESLQPIASEETLRELASLIVRVTESTGVPGDGIRRLHDKEVHKAQVGDHDVMVLTAGQVKGLGGHGGDGSVALDLMTPRWNEQTGTIYRRDNKLITFDDTDGSGGTLRITRVGLLMNQRPLHEQEARAATRLVLWKFGLVNPTTKTQQ